MIQYIEGEVGIDYWIVRNEQTIPPSAVKSCWGTRFPGQSLDGYGRRIATDMMLFFRGKRRGRRVYATCFSNVASHWVIVGGKVQYLPTIWKSDIVAELPREGECARS